MRLIIAICLLILLSSCSVKITEVSLCPEVTEDSYLFWDIKIEGSSLETTTDQKADGKLDANVSLVPE